MSFDKYKTFVEEGDTAIVYIGYDSVFQVVVRKEKITQTKYGAIKHDKLIGHEFGAKFQCSKGYVHILHPTPELWTVSLPHRTQILYSTDISVVTMQLDLKPGSVVCESGTGSASLSHAILRTIMPSGHLHTVEFHEKRSQQAREEFQAHGFGDCVTVYHRDVIAEGFPIENQADAVFLDIPKPYDAISHAVKTLKSGGRLCSFSPCIEQVQRTYEKLHESRCFEDLETIELIHKPHNVRRITLPILNMGLSDPGVMEALGQNIPQYSYKTGDPLPVGEIVTPAENPDADLWFGQRSKGKNAKLKRKMNYEKSRDQNNDDVKSKILRNGGDDVIETNSDKMADREERKEPSTPTPPSFTKYAFSSRACAPPKEIYGHTGYLTFATYCPDA